MATRPADNEAMRMGGALIHGPPSSGPRLLLSGLPLLVSPHLTPAHAPSSRSHSTMFTPSSTLQRFPSDSH